MRLLRTRSLEGSPSSPKDETMNWFDEIKARVGKKSQSSSDKQASSAIDLSTSSGEPASSTETGDRISRILRFHKSKGDHLATKGQCDNSQQLSKVEEESDDEQTVAELSSPDCSLANETTKDDFISPSTSLRRRKLTTTSCVESPDFDTASINTIFNRRDSRYDTILRAQRRRTTKAKLLGSLRWIIDHLLPFNYDLPWKIVALVNFLIVIMVIAVTNRASINPLPLNFFNGFLSGLVVSTICFMIVILSIFVSLLPSSGSNSFESHNKTQHTTLDNDSDRKSSHRGCTRRTITTKESIDPKSASDDYSTCELLTNVEAKSDERSADAPIYTEDHRGWMIEFIGDYELRNKSDVKLKLLYVKLEDGVLYLCKTKNANDVETRPVFTQQRIYDLNLDRKFNARILLPRNVRNRQKWVWSKKYPIRLEFLSEESDQIISNKTQDTYPKTTVISLTLFAKSCREKEEWFRVFRSIIDGKRVVKFNATKRASLQSTTSSVANDESFLCSFKNLDLRSPSPMNERGRVQTSRSSHLLGDIKTLSDSKRLDDELAPTSDVERSTSGSLVRTKSCELLHAESYSASDLSKSKDELDLDDEDTKLEFSECQDDSTLTRETGDLFNQAVEFDNFMQSRPIIDYKDYIENIIDSCQDATETSDWFNALTGRIFYDVLSQSHWSHWFKRKIQRKLYRIRLPYFMETLTLTSIDLGTNAPHFLNVVSHCFDATGLKIDFDMVYSGGLTMTFETKLNLLKMKPDNPSVASSNASATGGQASNPPPATTTNDTSGSPASGSSTIASTNQQSYAQHQQMELQDNISTTTTASSRIDNDSSEMNLSAAATVTMTGLDKWNRRSLSSSSAPASTRTSGESTSSDSDSSDSESSSGSSIKNLDLDEISDWEDYGAEKTRQSILRFVDKIASSRYFQQATENRYIKKKLQDLSNCPLMLIVTIQQLNGVLTVNVPPPKTDRIWYGFKPNVELSLKALPKLGDREVNLSHVTDWIEKKLAEEFKKILVIPNMEDIVLPVLRSDHLSYITTTK